jgi:hypothetical protein
MLICFESTSMITVEYYWHPLKRAMKILLFASDLIYVWDRGEINLPGLIA